MRSRGRVRPDYASLVWEVSADMLDIGAVREVVGREWGVVLARLAGLDNVGWARWTRCAGWRVADLVAHVAWGVSMEADALRRARAGDAGPAQGLRVEADEPAARLLEVSRSAVEDLRAQLGVLDAADLDHNAPLPVGDLPVRAALQVFAVEAGVHASDLRHALGEDNALAEDVVMAAVVVLTALLPVMATMGAPPPRDGVLAIVGSTLDLRAVARDGRWTIENDAPPTAWVRGADSDVLLFALGRLPYDSPRLMLDGDQHLATRFKDYVPGP